MAKKETKPFLLRVDPRMLAAVRRLGRAGPAEFEWADRVHSAADAREARRETR